MLRWMLNTLLVAGHALVYQGGYGGDYGGPRPGFQRYNAATNLERCISHNLSFTLGCA